MNKVGEISDCSALDLATKLRLACDALHDEASERTLCQLGTNLKALGEKVVTHARGINIVPAILKNLLGQFLIAGSDSSRAHIYTAGENFLSPQNDPGFVAIGSGSLLAYSLLAAKGAHKKRSTEEAVCLAYEAKKIAEAAYGVGKRTDMEIVGVGIEARLFRDDAIDELEKIYAARCALGKADKTAIRRLI